MDETLICFGGEVKALGEDGRVGGYLVRFSTAQDPDISDARDFFEHDTDYDLERSTKATVYFDHGLDGMLKRRKLGRGEMKIDDVGVWIEGQLNRRDRYEKAVYEMAKAGKLGWSSGTAAHLVEREWVGNSQKVLIWPLGLDASLTPGPAEPRNAVTTLKSYEGSRIEVKFIDDGFELAEKTGLKPVAEVQAKADDPPPAPPVLESKSAETIKGIFDEVLAEMNADSQTPWMFVSAFERAIHKIREASRAASLLATTVNFDALIQEAVSEIASRLAVWARNEFAEMERNDSALMPSYLSLRSPLKDLVGLKSQSHAGLTFQTHSETVLAAVEEFLSEAATLAPAMKAWAERSQSIHALRSSSVKAGRTISAANHDRMRQACMKIVAAKTEMDGVHEALQSLMELANAPEVKVDVVPTVESDDQNIAREYLKFQQSIAAVAA